MIRKILLLASLLFFPSLVFGQGVAVPPSTAFKVVNGITQPFSGATITVCAANTSGIPCSPVLTGALFFDTGLTQPKPNPFQADANGNYAFAIAPGTYTITITGTGFAGYSYQMTSPGTGSGGGGGGGSTNVFASGAVLGPLTFATLPASAANGTVAVVTDGTAGPSCTGGGTGALAVRIAGAWTCNSPISGYLGAFTVATLPSASTNTSQLVRVTDGTSSSDCSTGLGSTSALCMSNGASWVGVGGSNPGGSNTQIQTNNGGVFGGITNAAKGSQLVSQGVSTAPSFRQNLQYDTRDYGLVGDNSTDNTSAFNSLLSTVHTAGGGTIVFGPGTYLFNSAQITLPNNADTWTDSPGTISSQNPIRLTCGGPVNYYQLMSSGATVSQINSPCVLNFTFAATSAKLVTLGLGRLEVDHLSFINTNTSGADCVPFILTTNTELNLHDNSMVGGTGGGTPCQDLVQFGGTDANPGKVVTSPFQGYGTLVQGNFFNQCRRAVYGLADAGSIPVQRNTIWSQCSFPTGAAIDFDCSTGANSGCHGLMIDDNIIEVANYKYGIRLKATSNHELRSNPCWDQTGTFTSCIRYESGAANNFVTTAFMTGGTVQYISTDGSAGVYSNLLFSAGGMSNNGPMTESVGIRYDPFANNISPDILVPKVGQTSAGFSSTCNDPTTKCKSFYSMTPSGLQIAYNRQPTNGSYYDTSNGSSDIFFESNAIDFFGAPANTALTNWWQMDSSGNFVSKLAGGAVQAQKHTTTSFNGAVQTATEAPCETAGAATTLNIAGATTTTGLQCLPAGAVIDAVVYRVTTAFGGTETQFTVGDGTTTARFCGAQTLFTSGATGVCFVQADQTGAAGPRQTAAANVVLTFNATPTSGAIRLIVFYHTWTAPTS